MLGEVREHRRHDVGVRRRGGGVVEVSDPVFWHIQESLCLRGDGGFGWGAVPEENYKGNYSDVDLQ